MIEGHSTVGHLGGGGLVGEEIVRLIRNLDCQIFLLFTEK